METPTRSRSSSAAIAVIVVLVALVTGIVIGVAGDRLYLLHTRQWFPRRIIDAAPAHIVEHLDHELHFTPQQRTQVEQIVNRGRQRVDAIMDNLRPQMHQQLEQSNAEIEAILTPEQRTKFEKMKIRMRHGEHERGPHRRGPPPPPPF
jgi:Spy/CpxP family protein refolding chaperone